MATQKQIAANRQNAQQSTGPRTSEGKAASSRNALAHGLFSEDVVLVEEERPDYEAFAAALQADLQPAGALEESFVQQIAWLQWRINRVARIETGMLDNEIVDRHRREKKYPETRGPKDQAPRANFSRILGKAYCYLEDSLGRLSRYESHLRRSMRRCLQDLESIQKRRRQTNPEKIEPEKTNPISPQIAETGRSPIPFPVPRNQPQPAAQEVQAVPPPCYPGP
jgi:hypothetical protein